MSFDFEAASNLKPKGSRLNLRGSSGGLSSVKTTRETPSTRGERVRCTLEHSFSIPYPYPLYSFANNHGVTRTRAIPYVHPRTSAQSYPSADSRSVASIHRLRFCTASRTVKIPTALTSMPFELSLYFFPCTASGLADFFSRRAIPFDIHPIVPMAAEPSRDGESYA